MSHWDKFARRHAAYGPPLKPAQQSVSVMRNIASAAGPGRVLLLGVTPELAAVFSPLLAVDRSSDMIATVWPGDSGTHEAVCADWLDIELTRHDFAVVAGDGSLNMIPSLNDIARLLTRTLTWLRPGGRFVCRLFERPERSFTQEDILAAGRRPGALNFHALKLMIAMSIADEQKAIVPVQQIRGCFEELFPNRDRLANDTGWPRTVIDTIDVYEGSLLSYSFPSRREFCAALPEGAMTSEFRPVSGYPLCECCPVLSFVAPHT